MKIYLYNPDSGAPIKNWYDGQNRWSLGVGEVAAFSEQVGRALKDVYGFLQELSPEDFEVKLSQLEKSEPSKIKVDADGKLVPKDVAEVKEEKDKIESKKKELKAVSNKLENAKDAEPEKPQYWELSRGDLINELLKREVEVKGLNKKGVYVSKEQLINLLENDDLSK